MELKPEKISQVIRSQIKYYENAIIQNETGTVLTVGDGIARVSGLVNCMAGELLEFADGTFGMAQNLEENSVSAVLFGEDTGISEGQTVKPPAVSSPFPWVMPWSAVSGQRDRPADRRRRPHRYDRVPRSGIPRARHQ